MKKNKSSGGSDELSGSYYDDERDDIDYENRIVATEYTPEDADIDNSLRPKQLSEYIGQKKAKEYLKICIDAAKLRSETLDHVLLYGPPGLGKTTLSNIIAHEMGVNIRVTSGPAIEKQGDLVAILTNLSDRDVLFIDEIHRLPRHIEEILYPAMEDKRIDIIIGKGPSAQSIHLPLPNFTLVGATTRAGQLSTPLRDRFGILLRLELYTVDELAEIVRRSASIIGVEIEHDASLELASRSRGTPRVANRLLHRIRDFAQVRGNGKIDLAITNEALNMLEIDELGLDNIDRLMLETIINFYEGGPVGLETLSATVGEEAVTLEDVYEPYLMQIGFLARTPRGRCVTRLAYEHLNLPYHAPDKNNGAQLDIFSQSLDGGKTDVDTDGDDKK